MSGKCILATSFTVIPRGLKIMSENLRIGIVGGSIGGLATARVFLDRGDQVEIFERSGAPLDDRGAGIAMDPAVADRLEMKVGDPVSFCRVFDRDGRVVWNRRMSKRVTSWSAAYHALAEGVPESVIRRGAEVSEAGEDADGPWLRLADGSKHRFDLLVGADGIGSVVRRLVDPGFRPEYLGYVAFRGMLPMSTIPGAARRVLDIGAEGGMVNHYLDRSHVVAYVIPSLQGERVVNWMWYRNVPSADLSSCLTDRDGVAHEWSVPPGRLRTDLESSLVRDARDLMEPGIASLIESTKNPSIQAIFAGNATRFHAGRLVLVGDAARIAIPHIGAGTSMAIGDAFELGRMLGDASDAEFPERLDAWDLDRRETTLPAVEFARELGCSLQFSDHDWGTWSDGRFTEWWRGLVGGRRLYFESADS